MRRVERTKLLDQTANALRAYQAEADRQRQSEGFDAVSFWENRRQSRTIQEVLAILKRMAGADESCMYCVCSEAADIEHFWPKTPYPERMFLWENHLLCCGICNRKKRNEFPTANGEPLLIDPTSENPWEFLDFDPRTGIIVPRVNPLTGEEQPKGQETVRILQLDRRQGIANRYKKTARRIVEIVELILAEGFAESRIKELRGADNHGLLGWGFNGAGQNDAPFRSLRERCPEAWAACQLEFL